MVKLIKVLSINYFFLVSFIILSSLFVSENLFSRNHWTKEFTLVKYDPDENAIFIVFIVFNYYFLINEKDRDHAYLQWCDFQFSLNGKTYTRLMRAETSDQVEKVSTMFKMTDKFKDADLQFLGCRIPEDASMWQSTQNRVDIEVINTINPTEYKQYAQFTVKWILGDKYKNVKNIRLNGVWIVKKGGKDIIKNVEYDIQNKSILKSSLINSDNNEMKVAKNSDTIVITGSKNEENIKV